MPPLWMVRSSEALDMSLEVAEVLWNLSHHWSGLEVEMMSVWNKHSS